MSRVVLITGSRDWTDEAAIASALEGATLVLHGDARGADSIADRWARAHGVQLEVIPADWANLGKLAGHERNARLVARALLFHSTGVPTEVRAFPLPQSRGTWDCVRLARAAGLVVHVWGERAER